MYYLMNKNEKIAVIGEFAVKPRFQGGGSSHINSFKISSLMDALKEYENVTYIKGFSADEDCYEERTILDHSSGEISTEDAAVPMESRDLRRTSGQL